MVLKRNAVNWFRVENFFARATFTVAISSKGSWKQLPPFHFMLGLLRACRTKPQACQASFIIETVKDCTPWSTKKGLAFFWDHFHANILRSKTRHHVRHGQQPIFVRTIADEATFYDEAYFSRVNFGSFFLARITQKSTVIFIFILIQCQKKVEFRKKE